jgi:hypothetical protein
MLSMFFLSSCQSPYYYRELKIDSNLHLILIGGMAGFRAPDADSYYAPFYGAHITSVDHFENKPGAIERERSLYLETDQHQVLDRTVKDDEILRGPFGAVNAVRECFYTRPIKNGPGYISVEFNANDVQHELPAAVSSQPESLPALSSISLIRIFRTDPGYVIVSASYERDGSLGSLNFGYSDQTARSWTAVYRPTDPLPELGPLLTKFGIPTRIDIEKYLRTRRMLLPDVALSQEKNVMNEFYGFGKFIRQDELENGTIVASRWLQPSETGEEKDILNALCDARFRQQQALGLSTVESY